MTRADIPDRANRQDVVPALGAELPEIVISDSDPGADAAELRDAVHEFNFDALGYREVGTSLDVPVGFSETHFEKTL